MKAKWIFMTAAAVIVSMTVSQAISFTGSGKPGGHRSYCPQMSGYWETELNLSETQKETIRSMNADVTRRTNDLREELYSRYQELRQLWAETDPDEARILDKYREIEDLRSAFRKEITRHRMDMRNEVLTPEQREKLSEMIQDRRRTKEYRRQGMDGRTGRAKPENSPR